MNKYDNTEENKKINNKNILTVRKVIISLLNIIEGFRRKC